MSASPGGDFKIHGGKSASKLVVEAQWLEHSLTLMWPSWFIKLPKYHSRCLFEISRKNKQFPILIPNRLYSCSQQARIQGK